MNAVYLFPATPDLAEQAGAAIASNCLTDMLNAPSQAVSVTVLQNALIHLQRLPHPDHAAAGFAGALVAVINPGRKPGTEDAFKCLQCDDSTNILNVGREHFAVCLPCKTYQHIGSNLFSGWQFETPEEWVKNRQILDALIEVRIAPMAAPDDEPLPF